MSVGMVLHGGGPTPVINASLLGVVEEARRSGMIQLFGARFGIDGILKRDFVDLLALDPARLAAIARTPSSALGTSRRYVDEETAGAIVRVLRSRGVDYLFFNGGNGSMGAVARIAEAGSDLCVIGIPKTIDNDLTHTDHTPGYPTVARFFACAARDIGADNRALPGQVEFIEVLGRNTGWLVAATALARRDPDDAPHLIYLPEIRLSLEQLLDDVDRVYRRLGRCVAAVCEGQLDEHGQPFGADVRSSSGRPLAMNLAHRLAMIVSEKLKLRARSEKPGLLARSGAAYFSQLDWDEARLVGQAAVRAAVDGLSGVMITLERDTGRDHSARYGSVPLAAVASVERAFPAEWRDAAGNDVTSAFIDYAAPLIGEIEHYPVL